MALLWDRSGPLLDPGSCLVHRLRDGAATPDWSAIAPPARVAWLMTYPDTSTRWVCPTRGLQILYEILNERLTPGRAVLRPVDRLEAEMRSHRRALFSVDTHRTRARSDLLAFNLSAELTYTNLLNCIDLAGVPVRLRRSSGASPAGGDRRPLRVQPRACRYVVDLVVLGDGEVRPSATSPARVGLEGVRG